ncbi:MAG: hypothetical protein WCG00_09395 [Hyphomicrobiales bacterium]
MMTNLSHSDMAELAGERASRRVSKPRFELFVCGPIGMAITGTVLAAFTGLAGLKSDGLSGAMAVTTVLGFLIPWAVFKYQEKEYYKIWSSEYESLRASNGDESQKAS